MNLDELKAKHGRIRAVSTSAGVLVFRKPTRAEYKKFQKLARDPETNDVSDETLASDTIVSHTREEFGAMLEEWPGLMGGKEINRAMQELAGIVRTDEGKG